MVRRQSYRNVILAAQEVCPFTPTQIKLFETFAAQAVIAIENVRLFNETKEALEQQTATSEILGSSPARRPMSNRCWTRSPKTPRGLCDANDALIHRIDGDVLVWWPHYGPVPTLQAGVEVPYQPRIAVMAEPSSTDKPIHVHDTCSRSRNRVSRVSRHFSNGRGTRTLLGTPLLREGIPIGAIHDSPPGSASVLPTSRFVLLRTFADQAVIAIENVRLFTELNERNAELREALEHQAATAEVLGIIRRSPTDVQPVSMPSSRALHGSVASMTWCCDSTRGTAVPRAHFGPIPITALSSVVMIQGFIGYGSTARCPYPMSSHQNDFPMLGSSGGWRTFLALPFVSRGNSLDH